MALPRYWFCFGLLYPTEKKAKREGTPKQTRKMVPSQQELSMKNFKLGLLSSEGKGFHAVLQNSHTESKPRVPTYWFCEYMNMVNLESKL